MCDEFYKLPRLYSEDCLAIQANISLTPDQSHYLRNVMRRHDGDQVRIFNGKDGEFICALRFESKKKATAVVMKCLHEQTIINGRTILIFTPLPKGRMDFLIEKSVELGATDLMPVVTRRCDVRKVNGARVNAQMIEAAEQCERLTLPLLHKVISLPDLLVRWGGDMPDIQWCCERNVTERRFLGDDDDVDQAFLVGPAGGFDDDECRILAAHDCVVPISLGDDILRAETASLMCLSAHKMAREKR